MATWETPQYDTVESEGGIIAPEGDVILVVGYEQTRFRVSSIALSNASAVFKALFGPHFREGQHQRSADSPVEIPLPEDIPGVIDQICRLLHFKRVAVFDGLIDANAPFFFAKFVDKYDCADALHMQSRALLCAWREQNPNTDDASHLYTMARAAYLLRDPVSFEQITGMLITRFTGYISLDVHRMLNCEIPALVARQIEQERRSAQDKLYTGFVDMSRCGCGNGFDFTTFLSRIAQAFGVKCWPPMYNRAPQISTHSAITTINNLIAQDSLRKRCQRCCDHGGPGFAIQRVSLIKLVKDLENRCEGLCLECTMLRGDDDLATEQCSKHGNGDQ